MLWSDFGIMRICGAQKARSFLLCSSYVFQFQRLSSSLSVLLKRRIIKSFSSVVVVHSFVRSACHSSVSMINFYDDFMQKYQRKIDFIIQSFGEDKIRMLVIRSRRVSEYASRQCTSYWCRDAPLSLTKLCMLTSVEHISGFNGSSLSNSLTLRLELTPFDEA